MKLYDEMRLQKRNLLNGAEMVKTRAPAVPRDKRDKNMLMYFFKLVYSYIQFFKKPEKSIVVFILWTLSLYAKKLHSHWHLQ